MESGSGRIPSFVASGVPQQGCGLLASLEEATGRQQLADGTEVRLLLGGSEGISDRPGPFRGQGC